MSGNFERYAHENCKFVGAYIFLLFIVIFLQDKEKINSSLDVVNDFLRIMEPLRDEMDYWINFFTRKKEELNIYFNKINEVDGTQVSFFDESENII